MSFSSPTDWQYDLNKKIHAWNQTEKIFPEKTIHQLFEEQAQRTPNAIAVKFESTQLTYQELDNKANQLAYYLQKYYLSTQQSPDPIIILCLERNPWMIISILAVLKTGAAYIPIDPYAPSERVRHILQDTAAKIILTQRYLSSRLAENFSGNIIHLEEVTYTDKFSLLLPESSPNDLVYVIYTSGTTGKPKGVMTTHRSLVNRLHWMQHKYQFGSNDRVLQKTPYVFDVSIWELLLPLISGGQLVFMLPDAHKDPAAISAVISKFEITRLHFVPSMLMSYLSFMENNKSRLHDSLRSVFCSGEALPISAYKKFKIIYPGKELHNLYGPTEAAIDVSYYELNEKTSANVPIGKPIDNTQLFILNDSLDPVPIGEAGELFIGGVNLAKGYLNLPQLTTERFIPNPFGEGRLYKTGDLARYLPDGNIEYLGRNDFQVKIRGFRIELGEIENVLAMHADIQQAVVVIKNYNEQQLLVAYYLAKHEINIHLIQDHLRSFLPDYMMPNFYKHLASLPLTTNGKVDRTGLPEITWQLLTNHEIPRDEIEANFITIWEKVLGINGIGIEDNFFNLGGNSLLAIQVAHELSVYFKKRLSVVDLFKYPTVKQLKEKLLTAGAWVTITAYPNEETLPLSFSQERLWFIDRYEQGTIAYNLPWLLALRPEININCFKKALESVVSRHEILRTVFMRAADGSYSQVVKNTSITVVEEVITKKELSQKIREAIHTVFFLEKEFPIKVFLFITAQDTHALILFHHIAFDGWSTNIFLKELKNYYDALTKHTNLSLPSLDIQYKDYAIWQREYLSGERLEKLLAFWQDKLKHHEPLNLLTDKPRPAKIDYRGSYVYFKLDKKLSKNLRGFAKEKGVTLYSVLLTGFYLLLQQYTQQMDLIVGTPVANRDYPQLEHLIGFFVNSLALRLKLEENQTLNDILNAVHAEVVAAQQYQELPFEKLVSSLSIPQDLSRHPLFQVMFAVQSFGKDSDLFQLKPIEAYYPIAKFDLSLFIDDGKEKLSGYFNYAVSLYDKSTIKRMTAHYLAILEKLLTNDKQLLKTFSCLSQSEYQQIIYDWNQTERVYPNKTLHQLFEEQVVKTPDAIAVIYGNESLTYQVLNERANQLAHYLKKIYAEKYQITILQDTLIALCVERSIEMLIGILGVLKAGAAYVPIDPEFPKERIEYILQDIQAKIIVTQPFFFDVAVSYDVEIVTLNKNGETKETKETKKTKKQKKQNINNLTSTTQLNHLAYVIFTSGTTGKPKAIALPHRTIVNLIMYEKDQFPLTEYQRSAQFASIGFDVSIQEIMYALLNGNALYIIPNKIKYSLEDLLQFIHQFSIQRVFLPTALLNLFVEKINHSGLRLPHLKNITIAGELLHLTKNIKRFLRQNSQISIINEYGPSETHVVTTNKVSQSEMTGLLGRAIANHQIYILDKDLNPVAIGVPGEIHIGGIGLARGYWKREALTLERFIPNPFGTGRLYKTGDLARYLPDGNIEYLGRNDFQVKIRGFRIELGEIETILNNHVSIQQSVVVAKKENQQDYLVAYYAAKEAISTETLKTYLRQFLPDYMVPSLFMHLIALPLNVSGKVERKALPAVKFTSETTYVAPRNIEEYELCELWESVLKIRPIGIDDDFFALGGHSILAMQLAHRLSELWDQHVPVVDIFQHKTIAALCKTRHVSQSAIIIPSLQSNTAPLSFAQERLWFIEQYEQGTTVYHVPLLLKLKRDINFFKQALNNIVSRHEVLRTIFVRASDSGDYSQFVKSATVSVIEETVTSEELSQKFFKAIHVVFNLEQEFPLKVFLFVTQRETYALILFHHIAFDGWSINIFLDELNNSYDILPVLKIQYKDYAAWQRQQLQGERLEKFLAFWQDKLKHHEPLNLLTDKPRPAKIDYRGSYVHFKLDKKLSKNLRGFAKEKGVTLYSVLLTGFYLLLQQYTQQMDLIVGTPVANRDYPQLEHLIGFFVNSLVLRLKLEENQTLSDILNAVHGEVVAAQQYQELPFEKLVSSLSIPQDLSRHPLFQVMFAVQSFGKDSDLFQLKPIEAYYPIAKFDLSLFIDDGKEKLSGYFNYAVSLYDKSTIKRMTAHYLAILEKLLTNDKQLLKTFSCLSQSEYQQIIYDWNQTERVYPHKTLHQLFEEQVVKTPDAIAVIYGNESLTYQVLNERANQLAHYLKKIYAEKYQITILQDTLIALCVERSIEMLIGILGVLKAGAAYVPIDPEFPKERIEYILQDTETKVLITQRSLEKTIAFTNINKVILDRLLYKKEKRINLALGKPEDLACVIYTSGTTGKPKGVMTAHYPLMNRLYWMQKEYQFTPEDRILQKTPYIFDVSMWELFLPILWGSQLIFLAPQKHKIPHEIGKAIVKHKITRIHFVPSMLVAYLSYIETIKEKFIPQHGSLRSIFCTGEVLSISSYYQVKKLYPLVTLHNLYGPTEAAIEVSSFDCEKLSTHFIPLGKPIYNIQLFILDKNLNPVAIGVPGEIHIGGIGLARGYWKREVLTLERFIPNPFGRDRLYKTGDVARYLPDGNIEYLGRNDFQVKIRGFRIELGEIETILNNHVSIQQSVVVAKKENQQDYLVAYYAAKEAISTETLKTYLRQFLPDYMVPSLFMHLTALPLNVSGKVDRKALPDGQFSSESVYVAPRNLEEQKLCELWESLLGIKSIGIHDGFFELGGNSILAMQLAHRLSHLWNKHIPVTDIFQHKTIAALCESRHTKKSIVLIPHILANTASLSFAQERLWFIEHYEQGTIAYHVPVLLKLSANAPLFKQALENIISRHEILRTVFMRAADGSYSQVVKNTSITVVEEVITKKELSQKIREAIHTVFFLEKEFPVKVFLFITAQDTHALILFHHIAFDGWSTNIFLKELKNYYDALTKHTNLSLPSLDIQYKDYAIWQREYLSGERLEKLLAFWRDKLRYHEPLNLLTDKPRPAKIDYRGSYVYFKLDKKLSKTLRYFAKEKGVTLYSVLLTGFYLLLQQYTQQMDLIVGTPVANRDYPQLEHLIGFFVNSLVLRLKLEENQTLNDILNAVHAEVVAAQQYQELPFEKLVSSLSIPQDLSRHPLFQVMFAVQSFGKDSDLFQLKPIEAYYPIAKFDLSLFIDDGKEKLSGYFNYAVSLYDKSTIKRMTAHYLAILEKLLTNDKQLLKTFSCLSQSEYQQIIYDWNQTERVYPNKTLHQLFEEQVVKTPDAIAVIYGNESLTYQVLNERANQLAHYLKKIYAEKYQITIFQDTLIALCVERSIEMLIGILGILKAGAAYVPIDPEFPSERIEYILQDTRSKVLLTQAHIKHRISITHAALFHVILEDVNFTKQANLIYTGSPKDLACVIYTSGTTGKPKGTMTEHHALVNRLQWMKDYYQVNSEDKVLQKTPYTFDVSIWELLLPLIAGARLIFLAPGSHKVPSEIAEAIDTYEITLIHFVPAMLNAYLMSIEEKHLTLRAVFCSGEGLPASIARQFKIHYLHVSLHNLYGPTEAAIDVSSFAYEGNSDLNTIPLGKPIDNIQLYILDNHLKPVALGVAGELYIGGVGVARGYWNREALTLERFIPNPFSNGILYKTGDLARYLPDGNIDYLGRNDFQVKIRGLRIELGEIENILNNYPGIRQTVVIAQVIDQQSHLIAYYSAAKKILDDDLKNYLRQYLPDYMVPNIVVYLTDLPLSPNGKVDRKALPEINFQVETIYTAPRNAEEQALCVLWSSLLSTEKIGIDDDFFALGGHSILAMQVAHQLSKLWKQHVPVADIFQYKTIRGLLEHARSKQSFINIPRVQSVSAPLSHAQQRLWFIELYEEQSYVYHIPLVLKLSKDVNLDILRKSLTSIVNRHEILRTRLVQEENGTYYQQVFSSNLINITEKDTSEKLLFSEIKHDVHEVFDLKSDYPLRIIFYSIGIDKFVLINIHHIAFDGWSTNIFLNELRSLYAYYNGECDLDLPTLEIQYKDFAVWQKEYLSNESSSQIDFWKNNLIDYKPLCLPTDKIRPPAINYDGKNITFYLSKKLSQRLREFAKQNQATLHTILLSGFYILLNQYTGQDDFVIGMPIANRPYAQLENLIGFFVNTIVMRARLRQNQTVQNLILETKNQMLAIQDYQDLPFEKLVEVLKIPPDRSRHPIFQVLFSTQGLQQDNVKNNLFALEDTLECYAPAKFDLSFFMDDSQETLKGVVNYATGLFYEKTIRRLTSQYCRILEKIIISPQEQLAGIPNAFQIHTPITDLPGEMLLTDKNAYQDTDQLSPLSYLEVYLIEIWQTLLKVKDINVHDDFFNIGGNSLLVIQLVRLIEKRLKIKVKIAHVFIYSTIRALATWIATNQPITLVNEFKKLANLKKTLWMIHPSSAGSEVYQLLSEHITRYNCYGIDNYNHHSTKKIISLKEIANYYLTLIPKENYDGLNLLGWSSGGLIALEMASQLENQGVRNIKVYLLDTFLFDDTLSSFRKEIDQIVPIENQLIALQKEKNNYAPYMQMLVEASAAEASIAEQMLSGFLKYTQVVLFKAEFFYEKDIQVQAQKTMLNYAISLIDNNLSNRIANLQIIRLASAHTDIIEKHKCFIGEFIDAN